MYEYAVSLMHKDGEGLILTSTITSNSSIADVCLNSVKRNIKNGKYETGTSAILVMREVTPWCVVNMKPIDYKWNGKVT